MAKDSYAWTPQKDAVPLNSNVRCKNIMSFFGLVFASTLACQSAPDAGQIGFWESAVTSRGGIGSNIEFKRDGSYNNAVTVLVDLAYDIKDGKLYIAKDKGKAVSYKNGVNIKITQTGYIVAGPDGKEEVRNRINKGKPNSIIGEYSYRHYTGGIAYEMFTKNGLLRLRIPMSADGGCYSIVKNKLFLASRSKPETSTVFRANSKKLTFESEKGNFTYNSVPEGTWYKSDIVDYEKPEK